MARHVSFEELAELIVGLGRQEIASSPSHKYDPDGRTLWSIYPGKVSAGANKFLFNIIYFTSECTIDAVTAAGRHVISSRGGTWNWIYANQLEDSPKVLEHLRQQHNVAARAAPDQHGEAALSIRQYIVNEFKSKLDRYRDYLSAVQARHFIQPTLDTVDHGSSIQPLQYLTQGIDTRGGTLGVLIGEAGQGKTYYVWKAIESLTKASNQRIPIFISSGHWKQMTPSTLESLSAVIAYSFSSAGVGLDIPTEKADKYIDVFLRSGIFCVIFDSFDEYVLGNLSNVSAAAAFHSIRRLCISTEAPIFITTRSSFWSDLDGAITNSETQTPLTIVKWSLRPFTDDHARKYFGERFSSDHRKIDEAITLFRAAGRAVGDVGRELIGRGYFLLLIYEFFQNDESTISDDIRFGGKNPAQWMIDKLCEREVERQQVVPAAAQRKILRTISLMRSADRVVNDSTLIRVLCDAGVVDKVAIQTVSGERSGRGKLNDHPLIKFSSGTGSWEIKYPVIADLIISEYLVEVIRSGSAVELCRFIEDCDFRSERLNHSNLFGFSVDILALDPESGIRMIRAAIAVGIELHQQARNKMGADVAQLVTSLGVAWVSSTVRDGAREKRFQLMQSMFPHKDLSGAIFVGQLAGMDFSNCKFKNVVFDNVGFINCKFSSETVFDDCQIYGGTAAATRDLGLAQFRASTKLDPQAQVFIGKHMIRCHVKRYTREDYVNDFKRLLKKLAPSDMLFPAVTVQELFSGTIGLKYCKEAVLQCIEGSLVERHESSTESPRYHLTQEYRHVVVIHNSNGNFHGKLRTMLEDVFTIASPDGIHSMR